MRKKLKYHINHVEYRLKQRYGLRGINLYNNLFSLIKCRKKNNIKWQVVLLHGENKIIVAHFLSREIYLIYNEEKDIIRTVIRWDHFEKLKIRYKDSFNKINLIRKEKGKESIIKQVYNDTILSLTNIFPIDEKLEEKNLKYCLLFDKL